MADRLIILTEDELKRLGVHHRESCEAGGKLYGPCTCGAEKIRTSLRTAPTEQEAVEQIAAAHYRRATKRLPWETATSHAKNIYRHQAQAAFNALRGDDAR